MESMETPPNGTDVSQQLAESRILVVKCVTPGKILDKSDATSPSKVQPIKIVIPTPGTPTFQAQTNTTTPKMIISPVHLSTQPTVSVKLGTNQLNVKMVTNASLIQNSLTSPTLPTMNGVVELANDSQNSGVPLPSPSLIQSFSGVATTRDDSPARMTREQKQLQESINSSLVLSQMISSGSSIRKSRGRKKKSQSPKSQQTDITKISRSKSMNGLDMEGRSRTRSRSSPKTDSENEQGSTQKRHNMRSANAEFAQKQKSFMKEIINKTQDSTDEIDGSDNDNGVTKVNKNVQGNISDTSLPQAPKVKLLSIGKIF